MVHYEQLVKKDLVGLPVEAIKRTGGTIVTIEDFARWLDQQKIAIELPYQPDDRQMDDLCHNLFPIVRYLADGEYVFRVETGLARLLLDTNLPNITGDQLRLPFPAIYLEFPGKLFESPKDREPVIGCYLVDLRPKRPIISIDFVLEPTEYSTGIWEFVAQVNVEVTEHQPVNWGDIFDSSVRSLGLVPERLNTVAKDYMKMAAAFISEMLIFVINSILYATSASPEITEFVAARREGRTLKKKKKKRKPGFPLATKKYLLGQSIRVSYGAPKATDRSPVAHLDRRILKRFRVRGHWRWQPYGPERKQRKHIFISPHWKGPKDLAELLARKYRIA